MAPRTVSAYYREAALAAEEGYSPETAYVERMEDAPSYEEPQAAERTIYPRSTLAADPLHHPSPPPTHLAYAQPLDSSSPMLRPTSRPAPLEMVDFTAANSRVFQLPPVSPHRFEPYREPGSPIYPDYATGERDHKEILQPMNSHSTSLFDWGYVDGAVGEKRTSRSRWWKSRKGILALLLVGALAVLAVGLGAGLAKREKGTGEAKVEGAADGASTAVPSTTSGLDATTVTSVASDLAETLSSLLETSDTATVEQWTTSRSISFGSEPSSTRAEDTYTPPRSSYTPPSSSYTPPRSSSTSSSQQAAPTSSSSSTPPPPPTSSPEPTSTSSPPAEPTSSAESVKESSSAEETSSSQGLLGLLNMRGFSTAISGNATSHV